jgi:cyclopropane fatty-acyl-phospholipid synthase-like methyltransferase
MTNGTNGSSESRLDRVERILEGIALRQESIAQQQQLLTEQLQQTRAIADSNARSIQRVERITESNTESLQRVERIAESNARSVQAWEARIEENRSEAEEERSQLRVAIRELIQANQQNTIEHELFRRRFEAIDPLLDAE